MSKTAIAIGTEILIAGLVAGMLFGVGLETGVSLNEGSIMLMIMKSFCQATEGIDGTMAFNCWGYLALITVVIILVGVAEVFAAAATIGDWRVGLALYGFGWLVGLVMVVGG